MDLNECYWLYEFGMDQNTISFLLHHLFLLHPQLPRPTTVSKGVQTCLIRPYSGLISRYRHSLHLDYAQLSVGVVKQLPNIRGMLKSFLQFQHGSQQRVEYFPELLIHDIYTCIILKSIYIYLYIDSRNTIWFKRFAFASLVIKTKAKRLN